MAESRVQTASHSPPSTLIPVSAVIVGAVAMGISPILVRLADVGPFTSAFWRIALALPVLWLWGQMELQNRQADRNRSLDDQTRFDAQISIVLAGLLFAGDLIFWHLAITYTSVANATFLATLAPIWVVLGSSLFLSETIERRVLIGLVFCLVGGTALIANTLTVNPGRFDGDVFGVMTSIFFGGYFLAVRRARRYYGTGQALFLSSLVTAGCLLITALVMESQFWPLTLGGLAAIVALALITHAGGQGLLTYALGYLPAAFSSLVIFLEAVVAAFLGWIVLGEPLGLAQYFGAIAILFGIAFARPRDRGAGS